MIQTIFFYLIFIGFIYLIIKVLKSKDKVIKKTIFAFALLMLFLLFSFFSFVHFWKRNGPGNEKPAEDPNLTKDITFINNTKKTITVVVDFKYLDNELVKKANINDKYNKVDSIYIRKNEGGYCRLPIFYSDTIKFPENFSIKIKDSLGKIIKAYNKEDFLNSIEKPKYTNRNDIECKQTSWTLKIK